MASPALSAEEIQARLKKDWNIEDAVTAIERGRLDNLTRLIEVEGVDVNSVINAFGDTLLHKAALHGADITAEYLLSKGANVNARNGSNETPLHKAVHIWSNPKLILVLLNAGADTSAVDVHGNTPIEIADETAYPVLYRYQREAHKAKNLASFRAGMTKGTKSAPELGTGLSNMPSGVIEHIGSFLSGKAGTLNAQRSALRRNAGLGEFNTRALGGAGGSGAAAGAANKGGARRRHRTRRIPKRRK